MLNTNKSVMCTFVELSVTMAQFHRNDEGRLKSLHDIWLMGAPTPNSRIITRYHDPRNPQRGNYEARIVFRKQLEVWIAECLQKDGII